MRFEAAVLSTIILFFNLCLCVAFIVPQLCQAKGFVCEFCGNEKDIIFPFQLNMCQRCEGEHSLLEAGLGGSRNPFPRPSISLTWGDWNISKPRRLEKLLSQDRREGEGGEEALDERKSLQVFQVGKPMEDFTWNEGDEGEQEVTGGTESEQKAEKKCDKEEAGGGGHHRRVYSKLRAMRGERRERVNLFKALHMDKLKKSISKADSDSESTESQDEIGQERRKPSRIVSKLAGFTKSLVKRESEDEGKTEVKDGEGGVEKRTETQEEGKTIRQAEDSDEVSDKGNTGETGKSSERTVHKFPLLRLLNPHQLSAVLSKGRSEEEEQEEDRSGENDVKQDTEEATVITRKTWRGRVTRRARRITRSRKIRDGTDKEAKTDGGESAEVDEGDGENSGGQE